MARLKSAARLSSTNKGLYYVRYFQDFAAFQEDNIWGDTGIAGFASESATSSRRRRRSCSDAC